MERIEYIESELSRLEQLFSDESPNLFSTRDYSVDNKQPPYTMVICPTCKTVFYCGNPKTEQEIVAFLAQDQIANNHALASGHPVEMLIPRQIV